MLRGKDETGREGQDCGVRTVNVPLGGNYQLTPYRTPYRLQAWALRIQ